MQQFTSVKHALFFSYMAKLIFYVLQLQWQQFKYRNDDLFIYLFFFAEKKNSGIKESLFVLNHLIYMLSIYIYIYICIIYNNLLLAWAVGTSYSA